MTYADRIPLRTALDAGVWAPDTGGSTVACLRQQVRDLTEARDCARSERAEALDLITAAWAALNAAGLGSPTASVADLIGQLAAERDEARADRAPLTRATAALIVDCDELRQLVAARTAERDTARADADRAWAVHDTATADDDEQDHVCDPIECGCELSPSDAPPGSAPAGAQDLAALADRLAQAIGDPGSIVIRRETETVTRWSTRAVLLVLAEVDRERAATAAQVRRDAAAVQDATLSPLHIARGPGAGPVEAGCPCTKARCGAVDSTRTDPGCTEHPAARARTMRHMHRADQCPANRPANTTQEG